ncbi:D-amino acid aminotransferase [Alphaproteobacteria bacterium]|nr:D-amino acid aminotransferase [Alphaproteobacteria bacterium]
MTAERIVFLNGEFVAEKNAKLSIFDRGLLFADAVYEGFGVLDSQIVDFEYHIHRLERSCGELAMASPMDKDELFVMLMRLITENDLAEGFLYLHVTRGEGDRSFFYNDGYKPNIFAFTQGAKFVADDPAPAVKVLTTPDLRWVRRDIKTTNLLAQVMAKQAAHEAGAYEAVMIDDEGFVTEAGSSSFFFIKDQTLVVRPVSNEILHGITRQTMLRVADEQGIKVDERIYKLDEALQADEAFLTAASIYVLPISHIDDTKVGDGTAGAFTKALRAGFLKTARAEFYQLS